MNIYHILPKADWAAALEQGSYQPPSLQSERFIHFSTLAQVVHSGNRYYKNVDGLCVLVVDVSKLAADVHMENTVGGTELFPHLYGPMNLEAVVKVVDFPHDEHGEFHMPQGIEAAD